MELTINLTILEELTSLQSEEKFVEHDFYPGAPDETTRKWCESRINNLLERLIANIEQNPNRGYVKREFLKTLSDLKEEDTEEHEEAWEYLTRILTILGISLPEEEVTKWINES